MTESDNWEAAESAREEKKARELVMADRLRLRKLSNTDEATLRKGATQRSRFVARGIPSSSKNWAVRVSGKLRISVGSMQKLDRRGKLEAAPCHALKKTRSAQTASSPRSSKQMQCTSPNLRPS